MEERPRPHRTAEAIRCQSCGFSPTLLGDDGHPQALPDRCLICDAPLVPSNSSPTGHSALGGLESAWASWLEARRVERWIWFLFMVGLVLAATIGLIRGA